MPLHSPKFGTIRHTMGRKPEAGQFGFDAPGFEGKLEETERPAKLGLFARLFGRKEVRVWEGDYALTQGSLFAGPDQPQPEPEVAVEPVPEAFQPAFNMGKRGLRVPTVKQQEVAWAKEERRLAGEQKRAVQKVEEERKKREREAQGGTLNEIALRHRLQQADHDDGVGTEIVHTTTAGQSIRDVGRHTTHTSNVGEAGGRIREVESHVVPAPKRLKGKPMGRWWGQEVEARKWRAEQLRREGRLAPSVSVAEDNGQPKGGVDPHRSVYPGRAEEGVNWGNIGEMLRRLGQRLGKK